ncbi:hypothetical protein Dsin_030232 [Dipteronia sinensis]|uniref:Uncharacterized protein n=1 Tax=Dipteronia sinensis TaxID=43782 RepID=A0AAD9ZIE4_9ROSI|nr:hypothetical protein Dsin_030232 [Dipteronia sinensis]
MVENQIAPDRRTMDLASDTYQTRVDGPLTRPAIRHGSIDPDPRTEAGRLHQTHPDVGRSWQTRVLVASSSVSRLAALFPTTAWLAAVEEILAVADLMDCEDPRIFADRLVSVSVAMKPPEVSSSFLRLAGSDKWSPPFRWPTDQGWRRRKGFLV